ncbi:MAG: hypothetical protein O7C75_09870 [Verrucomicrobia bacterium]|nr:hypothetical protein [Verrucomicrobiota bacterium]
MTNKNAILTSVSSEYYKYFFIFNRSLQRYFPNYPELIVLWQKLTPEQLAHLNNIPRVQSWDVDAIEFEAGPPMVGRESDDPKIYYMRFLIFSNLFNDYDNILYLDTDITILRPLDELLDKKEFTIIDDPYKGKHPIIRTNINEEKLDRLTREDKLPSLPKFGANAGVFLAPRSIRSEENFQELMKIKERYRDYLNLGDQSVMNLWILKYSLCKRADFRYNFQPLLLDYRRAGDAFRHIHIFHFNGMVRTPHLALLMNMSALCWRIPWAGRWIYYVFHRFFFTQNTVRFPRLNFLLNWWNRRFLTL